MNCESNPRLSIIIPVYNEEQYLRRCLDSVYTDAQVEIIVVDDCSTDTSWKIAQEYPEFKLYRLSSNSGVSAARNRGIEEATGAFITFLDSDDEIRAGGIATLLNAIPSTRHNMIQFNHYRCHKDGCKRDPKFHNKAGKYSLSRMPEKWAVVWNKIYRRDMIMEHNIRFNECQQYDEDRNFNLQCLKYTLGIECHEEYVLNKHFDNAQSICHTMNQEKLISAIQANVALLQEDQTPDMVRLIRHSIKMHLYSQKFEDAFNLN